MKFLLMFLGLLAMSASENNTVDFKDSVKSFSVKLYNELAKENPDNFLVCPLSSELVLALVLSGAKDQTAKQLASATSLPSDLSQLHEMIEKVIPSIQSQKSFKLKTVNKMYVNQDLTLKEDFVKVAQNVFQSNAESIDFTNKQSSVDQINKWVGESTENAIKDLLTVQDIEENTKAVLLNAIYFQATWVKRFDEKSTAKKVFYSQGGETQTDMMEQTGIFDYHYCDKVQAHFLKMSYIGSDISMVVVLPKEKDGLSNLEANMESVLRLEKYEYKKVHVVFPKFKMDTKIQMKPILEKLGVEDLFTPAANLNGISDKPLRVSKVVQKNYIEVNEKGTIAASATAAIAGLGSGYDPNEPIDFIADHPFVYYITSPAGIMFVGRYSKPQ